MEVMVVVILLVAKVCKGMLAVTVDNTVDVVVVEVVDDIVV